MKDEDEVEEISGTKSTTTPKKGGLNGDPERLVDKTILTAK